MLPEKSRKVRAAGERLRQFRLRCGLSTRRVAELSQIVANVEACEEFAISHGRLVQIETQGSVPSIHKIYALSAIYGVPLTELLSAFVELSTLGRLHHSLNAANTHTVLQDPPQDFQKSIAFPVRFDSSVRPEQTSLLSRMVEVWGEVPLGILAHLNIRKHRYGWIGLSDYTMYPLIRPGSFVQVDECSKAVPPSHCRTEYDRPIYFLELRNGYMCSWCEVSKGRLTAIPHPLSPCRTKQFAFPSDAEIIGRVTGVAVKLVDPACAGGIPPAPPAP